MNERLKRVRKTLKMTQGEFGKRLGVTMAAISRIEKNERSLTDQMRIAVCREYNINESWLRTGEGDMFNAVPSEELDKLAARYGLPPMAQKIVRAFIELNADDMERVLSFIKSLADEAEAAALCAPPPLTLEEQADAFAAQAREHFLLKQRGLSPSSSTDAAEGYDETEANAG